MWVFEVSATSGLGVDLSPVSDKGFQGSCTAALPAQWFPLLLLLLLTLCSLNTHFLLGEMEVVLCFSDYCGNVGNI